MAVEIVDNEFVSVASQSVDELGYADAPPETVIVKDHDASLRHRWPNRIEYGLGRLIHINIDVHESKGAG